AGRAEGRYGAAVVSHHCLESHGLVAEWDKDQRNLTVWASTQAVPLVAQQLSQHFKLALSEVKCVCHYMGGGFGSKFSPGVEGMVAATLARAARAPVKIMLDRAEEATCGGMRPSIHARVRIAGNKDGQIRAYEVDCHGTPGVSRAGSVVLNGLPYVYE